MVGFDAKQLKVGDRVGGGYHRDACGNCKFCLKGKDIYCYDRIVMGEGDYDNGTFGQFYIGRRFCTRFRIAFLASMLPHFSVLALQYTLLSRKQSSLVCELEYMELVALAILQSNMLPRWVLKSLCTAHMQTKSRKHAPGEPVNFT